MERFKPFRCRISGLLLAGNSLNLWNLSNLRIVSTSGSGLRGRDQDRCWWLEKSVPQGPGESSPVRSAGLAFLKRYPSRTGTIDQCWQSLSGVGDQKPDVFFRPCRDARVFLQLFPALRTGLLSLSPSGTSLQRTTANSLS